MPYDDARFTVGGDDRDWCARVAAAGFRLAYEPGAVVDHFPVLTVRTFLGKNVRYGRAALRFRRLHSRARSSRRGSTSGSSVALFAKARRSGRWWRSPRRQRRSASSASISATAEADGAVAIVAP